MKSLKYAVAMAVLAGVSNLGGSLGGVRPRFASDLEIASARSDERKRRAESRQGRDESFNAGLRAGDMNPNGRAAQRRLRQKIRNSQRGF